MRIVVVAKRPPTRSARGGDGDANIACAGLDELTRRGHQVTVVSFVDAHAGAPDHRHVSHLTLPARGRRQALLRYPWHRTSVSAWQRATPEAAATVARVTSEADVVWFHGISTFALIPHARCPVVAHEVDPMSLSQREEAEIAGTGLAARVLLRRAADDYAALEALAAARAETYLVVTERDAEDLGHVLGRRVDSIPLGYRRPGVGSENGPTDDPTDRPIDRPIDVAFVGALNFAPNRHALAAFLDDVAGPLRARLGRLEAVVAGRRADDAIRDLCAGRARLLADPEDLELVMAQSRVCVFTNTFGRGERTTVREALAQATPVAGHPWALRNVPAGPHALIGEGPALVDRLAELLDDPSHWDRASASAATTAAAMPTWDDVSARLVDRLEEAAVLCRLRRS